jgi:hypothetical protein
MNSDAANNPRHKGSVLAGVTGKSIEAAMASKTSRKKVKAKKMM